MAMRAYSRRLVNPSWDALARYGIRRRFSGKVLGEEERAAENIYIKKMEQEKLEKLVQQGLSAEEAKAAVAGSTATPEAAKVVKAATATKISTDSNMNYSVIAGIVGVAGLAYWYYSIPSKKETDNKE